MISSPTATLQYYMPQVDNVLANVVMSEFLLDLIDFDKWWSKLFSSKPRTEENQDGITHEQVLELSVASAPGIAIRYGSSTLVNDTYQSLGTSLIIGERMPPHVFVRAASSQPIEIQDTLPADTRFKVLVFAGDVSHSSDRKKLETLAEDFKKPDSFLCRYGRGDVGKWEVFDVLCFSSTKKDRVGYFDFPEFFRPHYSKVLDDEDMHGRSRGGGYVKYGIGARAGAIVVVRPDGYVGVLAPLDGVAFLNAYFSAFLQ